TAATGNISITDYDIHPPTDVFGTYTATNGTFTFTNNNNTNNVGFRGSITANGILIQNIGGGGGHIFSLGNGPNPMSLTSTNGITVNAGNNSLFMSDATIQATGSINLSGTGFLASGSASSVTSTAGNISITSSGTGDVNTSSNVTYTASNGNVSFAVT